MVNGLEYGYSKQQTTGTQIKMQEIDAFGVQKMEQRRSGGVICEKVGVTNEGGASDE